MNGELMVAVAGTGVGTYCLVRALRESGRRALDQALGWFLASSLAFGIAAAAVLGQ